MSSIHPASLCARACLGAAFALILAQPASAQVERIPMTDQEILAYGGDLAFAGHYFKLAPMPEWDGDQEELHTKLGGVIQGLTSQAADDFRPLDERTLFNRDLPSELSCDGSSQESRAESQVHLPQGATLRFMRLFALDSNANQNLSVSLIARCQTTNAASNVTATVLGTVSTTGSSGRQVRNVEFPLFLEVDNLNCMYVLRAQLGSAANACGINLALNKVRIAWEGSP